MIIRVDVDLANAYLTYLADRIDSGGGAGKLRLYTAPQPAGGAAITTQTLIAEPIFSYPCAAGLLGGVLTFNPIFAGEIVATGDIVWGRIVDSAGQFVLDVDVGDAESSACIKLSNTLITTIGGVIEITSASLAYPL